MLTRCYITWFTWFTWFQGSAEMEDLLPRRVIATE